MLESDSDTLNRLINAAVRAKDHAYTPYSHFRVGAALLAEDGEIIGGCSVDNASYGATICAERTAIVKAVSEGRRSFLALVVTSDVDYPISPCGLCRQVLREFCPKDMPVYLVPSSYTPTASQTPISPGDSSRTGNQTLRGVKITSMGILLPDSFGPGSEEMKKEFEEVSATEARSAA